MRKLGYFFLIIVSLALTGCQAARDLADARDPAKATESSAEWKKATAYLGDMSKKDATPEDRAERLRLLKTNEDAYLSHVSTAGWMVKNCFVGGVRPATTDLWQQETQNIRNSEQLRARMVVVEEALERRVPLLGGEEKTCQRHGGDFENGHQLKLFLTVS